MLAYNEPMEDPILYIILNKSLKMSSGKAAAQAVHAAMMLGSQDHEDFTSKYRRTVVVLEAKNREQMDGIIDYLTEAGIRYEFYIDEGMNEVDAFSMTAIAVEPIEREDKEKRAIFSDLDLFGYGNGFWDRIKAGIHE